MEKFPTPDLSTPEGLKQACQAAREYVEAHVPGDHLPSPGAYFRRDATGCRCAVGYLRVALSGYMSVPSSLSTLFDLGIPSGTELRQFEEGFDNAFPVGLGQDRPWSNWSNAGKELGNSWVSSLQSSCYWWLLAQDVWWVHENDGLKAEFLRRAREAAKAERLERRRARAATRSR
jgi:hypothetical protein